MRHVPRRMGARSFPALWPPGDDGIEHRAHPGYIGRIIHIDRALRRIEHAIERLAHARGTHGTSPGAIVPADLPLLHELACDGLPVEVHVRMAPAHVPLLLGVNRIVVNTHEVKVFAADFDREVAYALLRRD